jgi:hypothetical protein
MKYLKYVGKEMLTRGQYGVNIRGGRLDETGTVSVFDPDFGDIEYIYNPSDWEEISREEWEKL